MNLILYLRGSVFSSLWLFLFIISFTARSSLTANFSIDSYDIRTGLNDGRSFARVGHPISLYQKSFFELELPVAIELANFSRNETVPWQTWRANAGLRVRIPVPAAFDTVSLGFFHESAHVTDRDGYLQTYTTLNLADYFDNRSRLSFEYFELAGSKEILEVNGYSATANLGIRIFTDPLNSFAPFLFRSSLLADMQIQKTIAHNFQGYVGGSLEQWNISSANEWSTTAGFRQNLNSTDLIWKLGVGISTQQENAKWALQLGYLEGPGKGMNIVQPISGFFIEIIWQYIHQKRTSTLD